MHLHLNTPSILQLYLRTSLQIRLVIARNNKKKQRNPHVVPLNFSFFFAFFQLGGKGGNQKLFEFVYIEPKPTIPSSHTLEHCSKLIPSNEDSFACNNYLCKSPIISPWLDLQQLRLFDTRYFITYWEANFFRHLSISLILLRNILLKELSQN